MFIFYKIFQNQMFFESYRSLINPFWKKYGEKFNEYFNKNYCIESGLTGWENFRKHCMPSTNNCLESLNRVLKCNVTNYLRLKIGEFLIKLLEVIKVQSKSNEDIIFPNEVSVDNYV